MHISAAHPRVTAPGMVVPRALWCGGSVRDQLNMGRYDCRRWAPPVRIKIGVGRAGWKPALIPHCSAISK
jgi:hypothetical protein